MRTRGRGPTSTTGATISDACVKEIEAVVTGWCGGVKA
ncbi:MAG: hypothetical protein RI967_1561 [Planctomycetota bacterium]